MADISDDKVSFNPLQLELEQYYGLGCFFCHEISPCFIYSHVVKFLKNGDQKYKSFFIRRMQQLANGDRSRILQKRLKGSSSSTICEFDLRDEFCACSLRHLTLLGRMLLPSLVDETYLEQKSGFRILWTEEGDSIVVWFVSKHKDVSRLMRLIDDSKRRSACQLIPESLVSELHDEGLLPTASSRKEVLLDMFGNTPLKVYDVALNTISDIASEAWSPKLHLTDEERDIVEGEGTTLVLGRSGTGKVGV